MQISHKGAVANMKTLERTSFRIQSDVKRRLKIYAAARDTPTEQLVQTILLEWLERQPPVGQANKAFS